MQQVSSFVTAGAALSLTQLTQVVQWGLDSLHVAYTAGIPGILAAMLIVAAHAYYNTHVATKTP